MSAAAVVGGGLVGSLAAMHFRQLGFHVDLYEARPDIRNLEHVKGRSINMAISHRGRKALRMVGMEEKVVSRGIRMYARMIHDRNGKTRRIFYGAGEQYIISISRRLLNEILLSGAEEQGVRMNFDHKFVGGDVTQGKCQFKLSGEKGGGESSNKDVDVDLIVGCDGAFSRVRTQIGYHTRFNFSQQFIEHGYIELEIPAQAVAGSDAVEFAMPANNLHIWPREEFMLIALPNEDCSFTVTLFAPFKLLFLIPYHPLENRFAGIRWLEDGRFDSLVDVAALEAFFQHNFADVIPLIGWEVLKETFFGANPIKAQPLLTVKCSPYNVGGRCVILGDAAHAMVPFYGQGMNAGFEDVSLLSETFKSHFDGRKGGDSGKISEQVNGEFSVTGWNEESSCVLVCSAWLSVIEGVLREYSQSRRENAFAICDLALYNYVEMRSHVNSWGFLLRKALDNSLCRLLGNAWVPLYTSVAFTSMPYQKCIDNRKRQDRILQGIIRASTCLAVCVLAFKCRDRLLSGATLFGDRLLALKK